MIKAYPRHTVILEERVLREIVSCLLRGRIKEGDAIVKFEKKFARYIGVKYALSGSSARSLLYFALKNFEFVLSDEIIVPAYTFFAMPLIVKLAGFIPIFVDVNKRTYNIDTSLIESKINRKTKAILVTHIFGQPCEMEKLVKIAGDNNLKLIEDCAHACGAEYKERKVGSFGDIAIFSFKIGKNMACFGGGMLTTNNKGLYEKIKEMRNAHPYPSRFSLIREIIKTYLISFLTHKNIFPYTLYPIFSFFNSRHYNFVDVFLEERDFPLNEIDFSRRQKLFSNLQAVVGIRQLNNLDSVNEKMRKNAQIFSEELGGNGGIIIPFCPADIKSTNLYYRIRVPDSNNFRKKLMKRGIDTKKDDMSICPSLDYFEGRAEGFPVAKDLEGTSIEIPNSPSLNKKDVVYISKQIRKVATEF